jgi:hypothetical protein
MLLYNEENYPNYNAYLVELISSVLGKRVSNRFGADWGGLDVWSVKGSNYEGTFIVIDDCTYNVCYLNRISNENGNIDNELKNFDAETELTEMYSFLKSLKNNY